MTASPMRRGPTWLSNKRLNTDERLQSAALRATSFLRSRVSRETFGGQDLDADSQRVP